MKPVSARDRVCSRALRGAGNSSRFCVTSKGFSSFVGKRSISPSSLRVSETRGLSGASTGVWLCTRSRIFFCRAGASSVSREKFIRRWV